jgi:CBS domain-containing protein
VARLALGSQPPISPFGTLVTERDGRRRYVDVKAGGLLPVTDLARAAALQAGADDVETHRRLSAAAQGGALTDADAAALHEAFETFQELRLECDSERLRAGSEPDGRVDPTTLDPINRIRLREAFKVVAEAQSHLRASAGGGRFRFPTAG